VIDSVRIHQTTPGPRNLDILMISNSSSVLSLTLCDSEDVIDMCSRNCTLCRRGRVGVNGTPPLPCIVIGILRVFDMLAQHRVRDDNTTNYARLTVCDHLP
jgi:hypothetical protein